MRALGSIGGPTWFQLGDGDLALHVHRLAAFAEGQMLSAATAAVAAAWKITAKLLPMSDDRVSTIVTSDEGELAFQDYFVRRRCLPRVRAIRFDGADRARPAVGVLEAIADADLIFIAPSNPWLSIDPILSIPGISAALRAARAPRVAVSPIVGGRAVKGPTAKIMIELASAISNEVIARHYGDWLSGMVIDTRDADGLPTLPYRVVDTLMQDENDRRRVGGATIEFARTLVLAR